MADIPLYPTSGSLVANSLEDIMAKRKIDARQAMLDSLSKANIESQIRDRDENTLANSENRKALAQGRLETANEKKFNAMVPGNVSSPDQIAFLKANHPEALVQTGGATLPSTQFAGVVNPVGDDSPQLGTTVTPSPSKVDPSIPITSTNLGPASYQAAKAKQDAFKSILDSPDFASLTPAERQLMELSINSGKGDEASLLEHMMTAKTQQPSAEDPGAFIIDQDGKVTRAVGPDNKPVSSKAHITDAPREPVAKPAVLWNWTVDGKPHQGMLPAGTMPTDYDPGSAHQGNAPAPKVDSTDLYDKGKYSIFQAAQRVRINPNNPAAAAGAKTTAMNAVIDTIRDPQVKNDVNGILNPPKGHEAIRTMKGEDLVSSGALNGNPAKVQQVLSVLRDLRGF